VQINHCAVLEPRKACASFGVNAPEKLLCSPVPERSEDSDHSEYGNTDGLEPESVVETCESMVDINNLIPALDYVSLHQQDDTVYVSMLFVLTDALASRDCDMLLPAHAIRELRAYGDVSMVTVNGSHAHNTSDGQISAVDVLDGASIDCDDDLDQDCEVENVDVPPVQIVYPSNLDLLIKEKYNDKSLAPFWQMAKQNKGCMFIKQGLLYIRTLLEACR